MVVIGAGLLLRDKMCLAYPRRLEIVSRGETSVLRACFGKTRQQFIKLTRVIQSDNAQFVPRGLAMMIIDTLPTALSSPTFVFAHGIHQVQTSLLRRL